MVSSQPLSPQMHRVPLGAFRAFFFRGELVIDRCGEEDECAAVDCPFVTSLRGWVRGKKLGEGVDTFEEPDMIACNNEDASELQLMR